MAYDCICIFHLLLIQINSFSALVYIESKDVTTFLNHSITMMFIVYTTTASGCSELVSYML